MRGVAIWIDRPHPEGHREAEAHLGGAAPFLRWLRGPDGKIVRDADGRGVADEAYAERVAKLLLPYDGQNARDVAQDLTAKAIGKDQTGVLRALAQCLADIAGRAIIRQQRGDRGTLRAVWLADFELQQMMVNVRAE